MKRIKLSEATAARRRIYFTCVDAAAVQTRLQSSDMSTFVVYLSKNGATPTVPNTSSDVTQIGATNAKGLFYLELRAADFSEVGALSIVITNTGGTKSMEKREIDIEVVNHDPISLFGTIIESTYSAADLLRGMARMLLAKRSGYLTGAVVVRDIADTKNSISLTVTTDAWTSIGTPDLT